jgi:hypothetical protein
LISAELIVRSDRIDRTFGLANATIDTYLRIDDKEVRALMKAINGTDCHAISVFALDAAFGDNVRHRFPL